MLGDIVGEFQKKAGSIVPAVFRIDAEEKTEGFFAETLRTPSFFSAKRLFVIERALTAKSGLLQTINPLIEEWKDSRDTTCVFWEPEIEDASDEFSRVKLMAAKVQEFPLLSGARLLRWLDNELTRRGRAPLPSGVKKTILAVSGGDLWRLVSEIEKHELGGRVLRASNIPEPKIWDFTDSFLLDAGRSMASAARLSDGGADEVYLIACLARFFRRTFSLLGPGPEKQAEAAKKLKLHPYAAEKQFGLLRNLTFPALERGHAALRAADENIKTGKLPASLAFLNLFVRN